MAASIHSFFTRYKSTAAKTPSLETPGSLFPAPARFPPSLLSPHALPGKSPDAEQALLEVLKHNHQTHHIFFNDLGYHK